MNRCQHPDCAREHDNASYCSRIHQRLDVLGIPLPEEDPCQECGGAWAQDGGLCGDCSTTETPSVTKRRTEHLEDDSRLHEAHTARAMTDDEMVEFFGVDQKRWEILTCNRWFNGSVWCHQLKDRPRKQVITAEELIDEQIGRLRREVPSVHAPDYPGLQDADRKFVLEPYLTDWHISMYAYAPETREVHWDTEIAVRLFIWALKDLVQKARRLAGSIERIIFPLGNDLPHSDAWKGDSSGASTAAGTLVDVDTRRKRLKKQLWATIEEALLYLREVAPVKVKIVPGNHGPETTFSMGQIAEARFHNDPAVTIDNGDSERRYAHFGNVLLGFTHGDDVAKSRLPMLPMIEKPSEWAHVQENDGIVEIHRGHDHHLDQRGFAMEAEEDTSIRIRALPTIVPRDAWHANRGYKHYRAAEAFLWSHEYGFEGLLNSTPRRMEDVAEGVA